MISHTIAIPIAAFIKRRCHWLRHWTRAALVPWVQWYIENDLLCIIARGDRIVGIGLARPLNDLGQHGDPYAYDEGGRNVWVDAVAVEEARDLRLLWKAFQERFGRPLKVGFGRSKYQGWPRNYLYQQLNRRFGERSLR